MFLDRGVFCVAEAGLAGVPVAEEVGFVAPPAVFFFFHEYKRFSTALGVHSSDHTLAMNIKE